MTLGAPATGNCHLKVTQDCLLLNVTSDSHYESQCECQPSANTSSSCCVGAYVAACCKAQSWTTKPGLCYGLTCSAKQWLLHMCTVFNHNQTVASLFARTGTFWIAQDLAPCEVLPGVKLCKCACTHAVIKKREQVLHRLQHLRPICFDFKVGKTYACIHGFG